MKRKDWIIFISDLTISYSRGVLRGVARTLESQSNLQPYAVYHIDDKELTQIDAGDVAGVLVAGLSSRSKMAKALSRWKIPMVNVAGTQDLPWLPWRVRVDDEAIGTVAASHLLSRGFRRFAFLGHGGHEGIERRGRSFVAAIAENKYTVECFMGSTQRVGRRWWPPGMLEWIRAVEKPAAIFCCNDLRAHALLVACHRAGIHVPEEVAILGVDNDDVFATIQHPYISTIPIATHIIAENALHMLLQLMHGKTPGRKLILVPPMPVMMRASTEIMAVEDTLVRDGLAVIQQNLAAVSVKRLVAELAVSRPTLEKRFFEALGRSPAAEIRRLQLDQTRLLLSTTELAMPQVAVRVGFSSAQQMSVSFKRFVGMSPMQYRLAYSVHRHRNINF